MAVLLEGMELALPTRRMGQLLNLEEQSKTVEFWKGLGRRRAMVPNRRKVRCT